MDEQNPYQQSSPPPPGDKPQEPRLFNDPTQPPDFGELPQDHRTMGMACHLAALIGLLGIPFGNALGPLIFWLIKKDEIPFVDDQGKEALNFQITILIVVVAGMIIGFATCFYGFILTGPIMLAAGVLSVVFAILAAMQANKGVAYRYPLTIRFIK